MLFRSGYDFSTPQPLHTALSKINGGIDDAYPLESKNPQITLYEPLSSRQLSISSDRGAVVVFSTTGFNDTFKVNGQPMSSELGIAIETQELPDMPNHPEWGNIELQPGIIKTFRTEYSINIK